MRITTNGRYGLRIMLDIALNSSSGPVSREDIARRQGITPNHIAQLFRSLTNASLAKSMMGPGGGYRLARTAAQIRVGDIIEAMEGPVTMVYCSSAEGGKPCSRMDRCAAHLLWLSLSRAIRKHLDKISLQDMCEIARQLEEIEFPGDQEVLENILAMLDQLPPNSPERHQTSSAIV